MEKLVQCFESGRPEKTYDEDVRSFCLTLRFYSPRAYDFVRSTFGNNLPSNSTIRNWYAGINSSPGFDTDAFDFLEKKATEFKFKNNKNLLCSLVLDGMAIRSHSQWNAERMRFDGFVDMGQRLTAQGILPMAKEALVFMVVGVEEKFKMPLAYFFINGLNTNQMAFLTQEMLIKLGKIGIETTSITLDGLKVNISMCTALGADFVNGKAYFPDPVDGQRRIYVILDPPHMMKLARNCVASRKIIDGNGRTIDWQYFELLHKTQETLGWNLGNKITKEHIQWDKKKMNVNLAAQTLSNSVATSMEFLKCNDDRFSEVDGTAYYARIMNDIFDCQNSTGKEGATGFKEPITMENHQKFFEKFDEAIEYIRNLRIEGEDGCVFSSKSKTPFIGFYNNMLNLKRLFDDYVVTGRLNMLIVHRLSQDFIESLFGCIRGMGGYNDNPTVQQFQAAFKKLLLHNDVVCSKNANCIDPGTKILSMSSLRTPKQTFAPAPAIFELDDYFYFDDDQFNENMLPEFVDDRQSHAIAYRASILENKIINAKKSKQIIKCQDCIEAFIENELMEDSFIRFKAKSSEISQPCKSTFAICKFVDTFLAFFETKTISFEAALLQILRKIEFESLYSSSNFDTHSIQGHKYEFVKKIVQTYMNMKSMHTAKVVNIKNHPEPVRHKFKKIVQQLGQ